MLNLLLRVEKSFFMQGFGQAHRIENDQWHVLVYQKLSCEHRHFVVKDANNFIFVTGTFFYDAATGTTALNSFFRDFRAGSVKWDTAYGNYCIGICVDQDFQIFVDRAGIYKVYLDRERRVFSSSFLSIMETLSSAHANKQAIYEYIFQGAAYGNDTIVAEVSLLGPEQPAYRNFINNGVNTEPARDKRPERTGRNRYLELNLANLRSCFSAIHAAFGNSVDCALSGGYDTRLLLALLREQGITPKLHVYGGAKEIDVQVAKLIASREHLELQHIDKSTYPSVPLDEYPSLVEQNFLAFDGWPPDGIFDNGSDLKTRLDRCASGELMLNGGGGEVFRNFFHLPDRPFSIRQFLWSFYCRFDPAVCTSAFSEEEYLSALTQKIRDVLGHERNELTRSEIEFLYPHFRCRFWMGRNTSLNNRFGWALTPFSDFNILKDAIRVPLRYKAYGCFEANLIRNINPRLASYMSAYGHDFSHDPPISRRIIDMATLLRPPLLRKYVYRTRQRLVRRHVPAYSLEQQRVARSIGDAFPCMSKFFHAGNFTDFEQYRRLCTLEYLFQKSNISTN